jgi:cytosine/adenosine deaminase-related metal-dependent hydrolase
MTLNPTSIRPTSIRNVPWAVVRDRDARRHVYRRNVDLFLADGKVTEITPAAARPQEANEPALDGSGMLALPGLVNIHVLVDGTIVLQDGVPLYLNTAAAIERMAEAQARMLHDVAGLDYRGRHGDAIAPLSLALSETAQ